MLIIRIYSKKTNSKKEKPLSIETLLKESPKGSCVPIETITNLLQKEDKNINSDKIDSNLNYMLCFYNNCQKKNKHVVVYVDKFATTYSYIRDSQVKNIDIDDIIDKLNYTLENPIYAQINSQKNINKTCNYKKEQIELLRTYIGQGYKYFFYVFPSCIVLSLVTKYMEEVENNIKKNSFNNSVM